MTQADFITQNSSSYTNEYSKFPHQIITQHHFMNIDDSIASLVNEINSYKMQGNFEVASKLISENAGLLAHYMIDASTINTIEEEIRNNLKLNGTGKGLSEKNVISIDSESNN